MKTSWKRAPEDAGVFFFALVCGAWGMIGLILNIWDAPSRAKVTLINFLMPRCSFLHKSLTEASSKKLQGFPTKAWLDQQTSETAKLTFAGFSASRFKRTSAEANLKLSTATNRNHLQFCFEVIKEAERSKSKQIKKTPAQTSSNGETVCDRPGPHLLTSWYLVIELRLFDIGALAQGAVLPNDLTLNAQRVLIYSNHFGVGVGFKIMMAHWQHGSKFP